MEKQKNVSAIEERTRIKQPRAKELAQDGKMYRKLVKIVGVHFRPTRLKNK